MRKSKFVSAGRALTFCTLLGAVAGGAAAQDLRPWRPGDSEAIQYFDLSRDDSLQFAWAATGAVNPDGSKTWNKFEGPIFNSPDGKYFFTLTQAGEMQRNGVRHGVAIYSREAIAASLAKAQLAGTRNVPVARVEFESPERMPVGDGPHGTINEIAWDDDSQGVTLVVKSSANKGRVHHLDVAGRHRILTGEIAGLFRVKLGGENLFYTTLEKSTTAVPLVVPRYPLQAWSREGLGQIGGAPGMGGRLPVLKEGLVESKARSFLRIGPNGMSIPVEAGSISFSPDGRLAVTYSGDGAEGPEARVVRLSDNGPPEILRRFRLDRRAVEMGDAVRRFSQEYVRHALFNFGYWSPDSRTVLVRAVARDGGLIPGFALIDVGRGSIDWLETGSAEYPAVIRWSPAQRHLELEWKDGRTRGWRFAERGLIPVSYRLTRPELLNVEVRQDQNRPPVVLASANGREIALTDPDPALKPVRVIPTRSFKWTATDGAPIEAGLLLPADYQPNRPVPLVIQLYHYLPELFLPDGVNRAGDAAQALAARGMAVLVMNIPERERVPQGQEARRTEAPLLVSQVDAAIDKLVAEGIVDPAKIGMIGFSRGGYNIFYAISHPVRTRLSAAVTNDSFWGDHSSRYVDAAGQSDGKAGMRAYAPNGREPWEDPVIWLTEDSTFNVDRIRTPLLMNHHGFEFDEQHKARHIPRFGVLGAASRPLDSYFFKDEAHALRRPLGRIASMELMIDWMAYWLRGEKNPDPSKAERFRRWDWIKREWEKVQAREIAGGESGFLWTRSGLMYRIDRRRVGNPPAPGDSVTIRYTLKGSDGSIRKDGPVTVKLKDAPVPDMRFAKAPGVTIPIRVDGLDEALRFLHAGEKATLLMPASIAPQGTAPGEVPDAVLRYEVEVLGMTSGRHAAAAHSAGHGN